MNNPKISVLMPVYNAEKYLKEAIDSILNQTFKDFEFLIINDASIDSSRKIILSYRDPRIVYVENDKNLGQAETMNRGLKIARAELIARMDADDISLPNRFELQYKEMQKDKDLAVIASNYTVINEDGNFLYTQIDPATPEKIFYTLQFKNCLGHATAMFRKHIILDIFNGYDKDHEAEDYDLWLKISSKYKISKITTSLLKYRISKNSRMGATGKKLYDDAIALAKNNLESFIGKSIDLDVVRILADINPVSNSPQKIKESLVILEEINIKLLERYSSFLDKSMIKKIQSLRRKLIVTTLSYGKFGYIFKYIFDFLYPKKTYDLSN